MQWPTLGRRPLLALGMAIALLAGCGGGGGAGAATPVTPAPAPTPTPSPAPTPTPEAFVRRALPADYLTRKAVAYSGYRGATLNQPPTAAQVQEDLQLLTQAGFGLIRVFGSGDVDTQVVLKTIADNKLDLKVHLGIWISGPKASHDAANQADIARGIALAKAYPSLVQVVSVGNETMVDWSTLKVPTADMVAYLQQVRAAVTQPVTSDDDWAFYANSGSKYQTRAVLDVIDFVSLHLYPILDSIYDPSYTDWKQESVVPAQRATAMMDTMFTRAKSHFDAVRSYVASQSINLPLVIGETGWKARVTNGETGRAHAVNQKMYLDRLRSWTGGPNQIFYFEAFDEPWKGGDDGWGLFNVDRKARYAIAALFPAAQRETPSYTDADAVYDQPAVANPPVTASSYVLFADSVPAGAASPAKSVWAAWDSPPTATGVLTGTDAAEGANALQITPTPKSWGWGLLLGLDTPENLSNFNVASGLLNFSIKSTYPGKLEVGFFTGLTGENNAVDVYLAIAPGQYGYQNDGAWHAVSVPISAIADKAAPAFGQPNTATLNMARVSNGFVIADRYAVTGNAAGSTTPVLIDKVFWSH